jgi:hypothetical protein
LPTSLDASYQVQLVAPICNPLAPSRGSAGYVSECLYKPRLSPRIYDILFHQTSINQHKHRKA